MHWAAIAAAISAVFMAWWLHWFGLVDLEVYRAGASAFVHGRDVYRSHPKVIPLPFTYPPFAAVFFAPLALLPDTIAKVAMSLLSAGALVVAVFAMLRLAAPRWPMRARWTVALAITAATPLIEPVRDTFRLGQVNLVLMALVLADMARVLGKHRPVRGDQGAEGGGRGSVVGGRGSVVGGRGSVVGGRGSVVGGRGSVVGGRGLPPGVLLGVAAAVKLTPGIFILYLLVIRRTREALIGGAAAGAASAVAWVLLPSESAHYWRHLVFDDRRIGSPGSVWNQSLRGAMARFTGSPDKAQVLWLVLAIAALAAGLSLAARLDRAGERLLGLGVAAVTGLLVSPISWNHHWVWALPLAVGLAARALSTGLGRDWWTLGLWVATFCIASISWWPFAGGDDYHLGAGFAVAADCYVLAALVVAGILSCSLVGLGEGGPPAR